MLVSELPLIYEIVKVKKIVHRISKCAVGLFMHDRTGLYGPLIKAVLLIYILFDQMRVNYCLLSINNMTHQTNTNYLRYSVHGILIFWPSQVSLNDEKKIKLIKDCKMIKTLIFWRLTYKLVIFLYMFSYVLFCFFIFL